MSNAIAHDLAHTLADAACEAGDIALAIELLERADRNGHHGTMSSIRTANRLANLRERILLVSLNKLYRASEEAWTTALMFVDIPTGHEAKLKELGYWHRASATQGNVTDAGAAALREAGIWAS